jgi:hypothetical protein
LAVLTHNTIANILKRHGIEPAERSRKTTWKEFLERHWQLPIHMERNHQGLENRLIIPLATSVETTGTVERRQRLGGLLNYYHRQAA